MPVRPPSVCACPGCPSCAGRCPNTTQGRRCPDCTKTADRTTRNADHVKVYNSARWKALRRRKLAVNPWCQHPGCLELATEVDHHTAMQDGGDPYPPLHQLNSLCKPHHSAKTLEEIRGRTGQG